MTLHPPKTAVRHMNLDTCDIRSVSELSGRTSGRLGSKGHAIGTVRYAMCCKVLNIARYDFIIVITIDSLTFLIYHASGSIA
jgi:hypothetical protein